MSEREKKCTHILALDPSGNFHEGKGTTGWAMINVYTGKIAQFGEIDASVYYSPEEYWQAHLDLIEGYSKTCSVLEVVIEDYFLYANKALSQTNSRMETPKVIGCIQLFCWQKGIPTTFQTATSVKTRWTDVILVRKGFLEGVGTRRDIKHTIQGHTITNHTKDAVRHAAHYYTFNVMKRQ